MTSIYGYQPTDGYHQNNFGSRMDFYQAGFNQYPAQQNYQQQQPVYGQPPHYQGAAPSYNSGYNVGGYYAPQQTYQRVQPIQEPQQVEEQPITGGVSSVLDYDLNIMSKFTTYLAFRLFGRSDTDNVEFISNLTHVLSSVRLPMSSLILANYLLLSKYQKSSETFLNNTDDNIRENLILALILANKANDDNTFINKSWSDATGLNVRLINKLEAQWLSLFEWRLHVMDMERFNELQLQFNKYTDNVKLQQEQQKNDYQTQSSYHYHQHHREPVSPILSDQSDFSPAEHSTSRFNQYQSNWYRQNSYNYQSAGFEQPSYNTHRKNYSLQMEPEYCTRTGSYYRMMYCSCHYCSTPSRPVDWSYNNTAAAC